MSKIALSMVVPGYRTIVFFLKALQREQLFFTGYIQALYLISAYLVQVITSGNRE